MAQVLAKLARGAPRSNAASGRYGVGGGVGFGAAPFIGDKVANIVRNHGAQNKAINQAVKHAPTADELKGMSTAFFDSADGANVTFSKEGVQNLWHKITNQTKVFRPNSHLDPKATGALKVAKDMVDDVLRPGSNVAPDLRDIHMLRQAAQRAALSSEGRDKAISMNMLTAIDKFVKSAKPVDIVNHGKVRQRG